MLDQETAAEVNRLVREAVERAEKSGAANETLDAIEEVRLLLLSHSTGAGADLGGGGMADLTGVFEPVFDDEGEDKTLVTGFTNCYYQVGGLTCSLADQTLDADTTGVVALKIDAFQAGNVATLETYASVAALQAAQQNERYAIAPLYKMYLSHIECDMRRMPTFAMWEGL